MERVRAELAGKRAETDASLDAERGEVGPDEEESRGRAQALADDLIERDRGLADAQLLKFRDRTDGMLARERADKNRALNATMTTLGPGFRTTEDQVVNDGQTDERAATDALVADERERADATVETGRREHEADRARLQASRHHTDDTLSTERSGVDVSIAVLDQTKGALAIARREEGRRADILAMVAHDLRSPLAVIAMNAQTIEFATKEDATREAAQEMALAVVRMERLLLDLLDLVRIESGVFQISKRPHDVDTLVAEVLQHYRPLFEARGLKLSAEGVGARCIVSFDHDRIVQVLSNLLGNAMKFTPRGGTVGLTATRQGEQVEFTVRDSGPGIRASDMPHLFERFWKLDSKARRGLGLGLNICEKIVGEHGGRIWADSVFGQGAVFHFGLPAPVAGMD